MRPSAIGCVLALVALSFVPAADATGEEGDPEPYECVIPPEHDPLMRTLRELECGLGSSAWELVWYYPPGVYQAWCFLTGDCPCPHCPDAVRW